jgi:hypothetical protein
MQYDALTEDTLALTELGQIAAEVRGENELWLAAALRSLGKEVELEPPQLAAIVCALLCPETLNRGSVWCDYSPSEGLYETMRQLEPARMQIQALQDQAGAHAHMYPSALKARSGADQRSGDRASLVVFHESRLWLPHAAAHPRVPLGKQCSCGQSPNPTLSR